MYAPRGLAIVCAFLLIPFVAVPTAFAQSDADGERPAESTLDARDLRVLETLLERSVREVVERELRNGETGARGWSIRFRGDSWARSTYLEGYGVMVAVQLPRVPFFPRLFTQGVMRARDRLQRELSELHARLQGLEKHSQSEEGGERRRIEERIRELEGQIAELHERPPAPFRATSSFEEERGAESGDVRVEEDRESSGSGEAESAGEEASGRATAESSEIVVHLSRWGRELATAREAAERRRRRVVVAATDAVVETLARYGNVVHGLEPRHRLAVVLMPAPSPEIVGALERSEDRQTDHYVISVPFGEIREFEMGRLSLDDLRDRVVIRGRTGEPVSVEEEQE